MRNEISSAQRALVIVPTYNERENLPLLVDALLRLRFDPSASAQGRPEHGRTGDHAHRPEALEGELSLDVLVVDDNSPDGTGEIADGLARANPHVKALHRAGKLGLGTAYLDGFRFGLKEGYGFLLSMDCDFSHDPRYVPALLKRAESAGLVIGSRYVAGGTTRGWALHRKLISRTANAVVRLLLGLRTRDTSAGFRCFRREALELVGLGAISSKGYNVLEEMVYRCEKARVRIVEAPIVFVDRQRGATKISFRDMVGVGLLVVRLLLERFLKQPAGSGALARPSGGTIRRAADSRGREATRA